MRFLHSSAETLLIKLKQLLFETFNLLQHFTFVQPAIIMLFHLTALFSIFLPIFLSFFRKPKTDNRQLFMRPGNKLTPDRQFIRYHAKTQTRVFFRHTAQFKHHPASFYDTNPMVEVSLSLAHTNFLRLFGYCFIRKNTYPLCSCRARTTRTASI
jgi:hypothetical protein